MKKMILPLGKAVRVLGAAWSLVGILLVLLLFVEGVCRLIKGPEGQENFPLLTSLMKEADWFEEYLEEAGGFRTQWRPYVYWRLRPQQGRHINISEEGIRRTWAPPSGTEAEAPKKRIFMFGGSTLWGAYARDDFTIPSHLSKILNLEHGVNVEVTNFGESGYVSTQEVITLIRRLQRGDTPDLVIFYDGVNDVFSAFQNGEAGLTQQEWHRRDEFNLLKHYGRSSPFLLSRLEHSGINRLLFKCTFRDTGRNRSSIEPKTLAGETVRVYASNLKIVQALGEAEGFKILFYWQPVLFSKKALTPFEQHLEKTQGASKAAFALAYQSIREAPELKNDPLFHDLSGFFDESGELIFIDFCHITEEGNGQLARRMAGDVLKILEGS